MMSVTKRIEFDAGHRVARHAGMCSNPHGHRYAVELTVEGPVIEDGVDTEFGMVVDFGRLKQFLTTHVHDRFDHGFVIEAADTDMLDALAGNGWKVIVVDYTPTAENLADDIFTGAALMLRPMRVTSVVVYETPTSRAERTA